MTTTTLESSVLDKTRELCQSIIDQPDFADIRQSVETFLNDEPAKLEYQFLSQKGEYLQMKQQQGQELTPEEVAEFETARKSFFGNPVSRDFMEAQQSMQKIQESVGRYVTKTFELGRVPTAEDLEEGSCGSGCGCH